MSETTSYNVDAAGDGWENRVKVGHLVVGLVFVGIAGSWALRAGGAIGDLAIGVLIPVVLVLAGVVGLVATVVGSRRRRRLPKRVAQPVAQPVAQSMAETVPGTSAQTSAEHSATPQPEPQPELHPETAYAEADQPDPHTEETAPIGSLPVDEPKEQT